MLDNASLEVNEYLNVFFGEKNDFKLEQVLTEGSERAGKIRPWVEYLLGDSPGPTVLPRWVKNNGVEWYALAFNELQYKKLGEELVSFVGPSYSTFRGRQAELNPEDPIDAAADKLTGGYVYKFFGDPARIWSALELMRHVWTNRPAIVRERPRSFGRVLRDFYMAIQAGNRTSAEEQLSYLHNHYYLDALNASFLKVQMLAELGLWGELLGLPSLPDLIHSRRPLEVTRAIIKAIYYRELEGFEEKGDHIGAVEHFKEVVMPLYSNVFSSRSGLSDSEAIKCFMMLAVNSSPPRPDLRDKLLLSGNLSDGERDYLQQIAMLLPEQAPQPGGSPIDLAFNATAEGDYDKAFDYATVAPPSRTRAKILIECAYELQTLASKKEAVDAVLGLPTDEKEALLNSRQLRMLWQYLNEESGDQVSQTAVENTPKDWITWLSYLEQPEFCDRALAIARTGAVEWKVDDLLESPGAIGKLEEFLQAPPHAAAEDVLYNALPHLLAFFQRDEKWPRRQFLNVYAIILDLLVMSTEGGDDDLIIFNDLLQALLTLGVGRDKYKDSIGYAVELWNKYASPAKLDWALDLADLLIIYPCPSEKIRQNFLFVVSGQIGKFVRRISAGQLNFIQQLHGDIGQAEAFNELIDSYGLAPKEITRDAQDVFVKLSSKTVAIYTLTERVAKRVKNALEARCNDINVHISNDKAGTDRLRQLARNVDIFVMATASAKHAATEFIEANRPKELPILRPQGKGSASMMEAIYNFLQ